MSRRETDPFSNFNFLVEIEGVTQGGFSDVSGLSSEITVIEYRNGNDQGPTRKLPGLHKVGDITLKRGLTTSRELWDWHQNAARGNVQRKAGSIILLDETRQEVLRWNFFEAWPARMDLPSFNATSNEIAIETLTLAVEKIELA